MEGSTSTVPRDLVPVRSVPAETKAHRAAKRRRWHPGERAVDTRELRDPWQPFLKQDAYRHPRHHRAEASVDSAAEAQVSSRPAPDIVNVGFRKPSLVAIGRAIRQADVVAGPHDLTVHLSVRGKPPPEPLRRGVVTQ